jgi:hypothetical protein
MPPTPLSPKTRAALSGLCSILLGTLFGAAAVIGMQRPRMILEACLFGAVTGLICSPVLIFALRYGPWLAGVLWIGLLTTAAAFLAGALTTPTSPYPSMAVSIGAYVLFCLLRGFQSRKAHKPRPANLCHTCNYDLTGLSKDRTCPECGAGESVIK